MKIMSVTAFGGPETLAMSDAAEPAPGAGEVLVDVEAIGVGLVDVFQRLGRYPGLTEPGFIPGLEVAGVVTKAGEGVDAAMVGRRVFAQVPRGGYAEKAVAGAAQVTPIPDGVSFADAVALGINALVAELALDKTAPAAGDAVLVRGAGGGIGVMGVQVAAARGAMVTAVTSSAGRGEKLKALGASAVVDRTAGDGAGGGPYDVILDPVAGEDTVKFLSQLKPNGRHIVVGFAGGLPGPDLNMGLVMNFQKTVALHTFSLNTYAPEHLSSLLGEMFGRVAAGRLKPVVDAQLPLAEAAEAHRRIEAGAFGKIVLLPK